MIGDIQNKWLRRTVIVIVILPFIAAMAVVGALATVEEFLRDEVRGAWRGRARG